MSSVISANNLGVGEWRFGGWLISGASNWPTIISYQCVYRSMLLTRRWVSFECAYDF